MRCGSALPNPLNSVANTVIHCPVGLDRINLELKPLPRTTCGAIQRPPAPSVTDRPFPRIRDGPRAERSLCQNRTARTDARGQHLWNGANAARSESKIAWASTVAERVRDGGALTVEDHHAHRHALG